MPGLTLAQIMSIPSSDSNHTETLSDIGEIETNTTPTISFINNIKNANTFDDAKDVYYKEKHETYPHPIEPLEHIIARSGRCDLVYKLIKTPLHYDCMSHRYRMVGKNPFEEFLEVSEYSRKNSHGDIVSDRKAAEQAKALVKHFIITNECRYGDPENPETIQYYDQKTRHLGFSPHLENVLIQRNTENLSNEPNYVTIKTESCCTIS